MQKEERQKLATELGISIGKIPNPTVKIRRDETFSSIPKETRLEMRENFESRLKI